MATNKKKRKKKNSIPVWAYAGGGVLVVGLIVLILFLTGVFGGGSSRDGGDADATDVITGDETEDPAALLDPEQAEAFEEIAADYLYISKDGEYNTDTPYDSIMIFSDATAAVYLEEYEDLDDFYAVTFEDGNITIRVEDKLWSGTLQDGVMTLQMDDGSTRVFATDETQTYEAWMSTLDGVEFSGEEGEAVGYYRLTYMDDGNGEIPASELDAQGDGAADNYIVLEDDMTGYMSFMYSVEEFSWDEDTIWFEYDWEEYTLNGGTLTLSYGPEGSLTFVKSNDAPPAKPEITDAEGVVLIKNATDTYFDEILFVPSTMSFEDSAYWSSLEPEESAELDLYDTGGKFPGRFDLAVYEMDTERTYFVRYLELYDGYEIELREQGGNIVFQIRDADGNVHTETAEMIEDSFEMFEEEEAMTGYTEDTEEDTEDF